MRLELFAYLLTRRYSTLDSGTPSKVLHSSGPWWGDRAPLFDLDLGVQTLRVMSHDNGIQKPKTVLSVG